MKNSPSSYQDANQKHKDPRKVVLPEKAELYPGDTRKSKTEKVVEATKKELVKTLKKK